MDFLSIYLFRKSGFVQCVKTKMHIIGQSFTGCTEQQTRTVFAATDSLNKKVSYPIPITIFQKLKREK